MIKRPDEVVDNTSELIVKRRLEEEKQRALEKFINDEEKPVARKVQEEFGVTGQERSR